MTKNTSHIAKNLEPVANNILIPNEYIKITGKTVCVIRDFCTAFRLAEKNTVLYVSDDAEKIELFQEAVVYNACFPDNSQTLLVHDLSDWTSEALYAQIRKYFADKVDCVYGLPPISYALDCMPIIVADNLTQLCKGKMVLLMPDDGLYHKVFNDKAASVTSLGALYLEKDIPGNAPVVGIKFARYVFDKNPIFPARNTNDIPDLELI